MALCQSFASRFAWCGLAAMLIFATSNALAQDTAPSGLASAAEATRMKIFLITFGPGDEAYEKFGHNAIWVHDPDAPPSRQDLAYNWGYFDFEQKNFFVNFVQGRMTYMMASDQVFTGPYARIGLLDYYKDVLHRSIWIQELNLTPEQKSSLNELLRRTDTDANRYYRYDYYRDNCSTRPRDVIDNLIGGRLGAITKTVYDGTTFRWHTRRLTVETPWLYTVLQAVLGHPVDHPISKWDEMFLPMELRDELHQVEVPDPAGSGAMVPLVKSEKELYKADRPPSPTRPPKVWPWFLLSGILLSALYLALGHFVRRSRAARFAFTLAVVPWLLLMGVGGVIILWGWGFTDHAVARYNENVLHVSPLMLPLVVLLPMLTFGRRGGATVARWLALVAAVAAVLGVLLKITPAFYQVNWDIIALTLPVNLALACIVWKLSALALATPAAPEKTRLTAETRSTQRADSEDRR